MLREDKGLLSLGINGIRRRGSKYFNLDLIFEKAMMVKTMARAAIPDCDLVKMTEKRIRKVRRRWGILRFLIKRNIGKGRMATK